VYLSTAMFSRGTALTTTDVPGAATASTA
jgi:hypothetical protein